jgi:Transglycosylase SLT domain
MKTIRFFAAFFTASAGFCSEPAVQFAVKMPGATDNEMIAAIAMKETGNNPLARGPSGERTSVQFMRRTWMQYSRLPHSMAALHPDEVDRVARAYLADIRRMLRERELPESPYFIAASWNAGINWTHISRRAQDYAECVESLVDLLRTTQGDGSPLMSASPDGHGAAPIPQASSVGREQFQQRPTRPEVAGLGVVRILAISPANPKEGDLAL